MKKGSPFYNKVFDFYFEDGREQMKDLKIGVAQSDMHFRMLTLTKEEKAVEGVKIHSVNKYLVTYSVCLAHIWQAGLLPARMCSLV